MFARCTREIGIRISTIARNDRTRKKEKEEIVDDVRADDLLLFYL